MRLAGKTALVTGAARGIGEAIAQAFLTEGATVWLTDVDREADRTADRLGPAARVAHLDVRSEADWERVIAAVLERDTRLDILVNN
ncbi:MAG: SDR family oxidoreductase, partial [Pseudomonadota bacterium]